jgi:hypothetical protein
MFSTVPWTRTTGFGCSTLGRHDQSLAPAGGVSGKRVAFRKAKPPE